MKLNYFDRVYEALMKKLAEYKHFKDLHKREKIMLLYYMSKCGFVNQILVEMILGSILSLSKHLTFIDFKILIISLGDIKYNDKKFFKELFYQIDIFRLSECLKDAKHSDIGEKISITHIKYFENVCKLLLEESQSVQEGPDAEGKPRFSFNENLESIKNPTDPSGAGEEGPSLEDQGYQRMVVESEIGESVSGTMYEQLFEDQISGRVPGN